MSGTRVGVCYITRDHARAGRSDAMSWMDQLRELEEKARKRLSELEPLVAEHRELKQLLEGLGLRRDAQPGAGGATDTAPADAADVSAAAASSSRPPARKRAA